MQELPTRLSAPVLQGLKVSQDLVENVDQGEADQDHWQEGGRAHDHSVIQILVVKMLNVNLGLTIMVVQDQSVPVRKFIFKDGWAVLETLD